MKKEQTKIDVPLVAATGPIGHTPEYAAKLWMLREQPMTPKQNFIPVAQRTPQGR